MRAVLIILFLISTLIAQDSAAQDGRGIKPDFIHLQYAGSIGFVSAGAGWDIIKDKWRVSVHYGHVPKSHGGEMNIFSGKFLWAPKAYYLTPSITLRPYDFGLMVSYHMGGDFRTRWPDQRYPENYYWWQTSFRFHLNVQPSISFKLQDHTIFKAFSAYVDINTNELYLVSYFQNMKALSPGDIIKLGLGARLHF